MEKQGLFLSVHVDDIKMAGKRQNVAPMWKKWMRHVDLEEPTSFLDRVYLGCARRECKPHEIIIEEFSKMFVSRISAGATEKLPRWKSLTQKQQRGPTTWKDMLENALSDTVNRQTRKWSSCTKFQVLFTCMIINSKQEELESVGELSQVCSQIVLKCLSLARIGRPDIPWSVNKLARAVTKWTQACHRRLARLISYIHHTSDCRQCCPVGNKAQHCRLGSFQDSDFAGDLEDSKSLVES